MPKLTTTKDKEHEKMNETVSKNTDGKDKDTIDIDMNM